MMYQTSIARRSEFSVAVSRFDRCSLISRLRMPSIWTLGRACAPASCGCTCFPVATRCSTSFKETSKDGGHSPGAVLTSSAPKPPAAYGRIACGPPSHLRGQVAKTRIRSGCCFHSTRAVSGAGLALGSGAAEWCRWPASREGLHNIPSVKLTRRFLSTWEAYRAPYAVGDPPDHGDSPLGGIGLPPLIPARLSQGLCVSAFPSPPHTSLALRTAAMRDTTITLPPPLLVSLRFPILYFSRASATFTLSPPPPLPPRLFLSRSICSFSVLCFSYTFKKLLRNALTTSLHVLDVQITGTYHSVDVSGPSRAAIPCETTRVNAHVFFWKDKQGHGQGQTK